MCALRKREHRNLLLLSRPGLYAALLRIHAILAIGRAFIFEKLGPLLGHGLGQAQVLQNVVLRPPVDRARVVGLRVNAAVARAESREVVLALLLVLGHTHGSFIVCIGDVAV